MVSTFSVGEAYGTGPSINGSIIDSNFGTLGSPSVEVIKYQIPPGTHGFEKYLFGSWGGTFTELSNFKIWISSGSYSPGEVVKIGSTQTFITPVKTVSIVATGSIPISEPSSQNVSIAGNSSGKLFVTGSSDYMVLQLQTGSFSYGGLVNRKTIMWQWDEL